MGAERATVPVMATVTLVEVTRTYPGGGAPAVNRLQLDVADGELVTLVGPSGSGKSTALKMLAGLEPVDSGEILIGTDVVTGRPPKDRDLAMVFQSYALYPHMSVAANIGFPLRMRGVGKDERTRQVEQVAQVLGLTPYLSRRPRQLSGGQRQRVAMGRAIIRQPRAFLMDEPLSNLDAQLRTQTRASLAELQARLGITTIYVTHDQIEAMTLGHRLAVLKDGYLQQYGTPRELYDRPVNTFVAGFLGSPAMNLVPGRASEEGVTAGGALLPVPRATLAGAGDAVVVGVRPESLELGAAQAPGALPARVRVTEDQGSLAFVHATLTDRESRDLAVVAKGEPGALPRPGESVWLVPQPQALHLFDQATGARLGR